MATTSPDNIRTPNLSDPYNLVSDLQTNANDVQAALTKRANMYVGTGSARNASLSTVPEGAHWQDTDGSRYEYVKKLGVWKLVPGQTLDYFSLVGTGESAANVFILDRSVSGLPLNTQVSLYVSGVTMVAGASAGAVISVTHYTLDGSAPIANVSARVGAARAYGASSLSVTAPPTSGIITLPNGSLRTGVYVYNPHFRAYEVNYSVVSA